MKHMADEATWDKAKELAILAQDPKFRGHRPVRPKV